MAEPRTFRDPLFASLAAGVEKKLDLPVGLVRSIIVDGERTNPDQVSSAGARGLGQFIPATREAMVKKYGVDPWLNDQTSIESIGLLLKENLQRTGGDIEEAVRGYHGGWDKSQRGKVNDAYAGRVLKGVQGTQLGELSNRFAEFQRQNPAIPPQTAAASAPAAPDGKAEALSQQFGQWLYAQQPVEQRAADIPGYQGAIPAAQQPTMPAGDGSIGGALLGAGEAALSLGTGMTGGAVGMIGGAAGGIAQAIGNGTLGTPEAVRQIEQAATQGAAALTYAPRTPQGQAQTAAVGEALAQTVPVIPLTGELAAAGAAARAAAPAAAATARAAAPAMVQTARTVAPAAVDAVQALPGRVASVVRPGERAPTAGTGGSVGAAGTDMATVRQAAATELDVPITLTRGQRERTFEGQRFERETAKDAERGGALRDRYAEQNKQILQNFDSYVDKVGATAPDLRTAGQSVDAALVAKMKRDKTEVNAKYAAARRSEEAKAPVDQNAVVSIGEGDTALTATPLSYINEQPSGLPSSGLTDAARQYAVKLKVADLQDGQLVPRPGATVGQLEAWRKAINEATSYDPVDIRQSTILKKLIDGQTEPVAGPLYRQARRTRELFARQYEDRAVISKLLNTEKGSSDRIVALEDVFDRTILRSSLDDVRHVRRVLQTGGEEGQQAWKELQGQTLSYLRDQATRNVARNERGESIVSAAGLNKAVKQLDADGKLDFMFGKRGAEQLRTLNDVASHVLTAPAGAVNTSNTASVFAASLDLALTATVGVPAPIASGLRLISKEVKDRKIRKQIADALKPAPNAPTRPANSF